MREQVIQKLAKVREDWDIQQIAERTKTIFEWMETAAEDLDAARALLDKEKYSHACFFAQQCGEKALKAIWYALGDDPWGHSIQKLAMELPDEELRKPLESHLEEGAALDRYYIPTRYPSGLPDLTPGQVYFRKDAEVCIQAAQTLLEEGGRLLKTFT